MSNENKTKSGNKSVTIRLDEPDLYEWAASQASPTSSIRTAIKICILKFGKHADLLDSIITDSFGNGDLKNALRSTENVNPVKDTSVNTDRSPIAPAPQPQQTISPSTQMQPSQMNNMNANQQMNPNQFQSMNPANTSGMGTMSSGDMDPALQSLL